MNKNNELKKKNNRKGTKYKKNGSKENILYYIVRYIAL